MTAAAFSDIGERLERAGGAVPLVWLWPDVPPGEWQSAVNAIAAATTDLVAGRTATVDGRAEALSVAAYTSGMGPLLGWWSEQGALRTDSAIAALFRKHLEHNRIRNRRMFDAAAEIVRRLDVAGIAVTLIKGAHTARIHFPDPATRPMSDVDLAVAPADFDRAERVLADAGFTANGRVLANPARRSWEPPGAPPHVRSLTFVHADDPWSIDLQASLDRHFATGTVARLQALSAMVVESPFASPATMLAQPALTFEIATHASQNPSTLNLLRLAELVFVIRKDAASDPHFWTRLLDAGRQARLLGFVFPALRFADQLAPGTVPCAILAECAAAAPAAVRRFVARHDYASVHRIGRRSLGEAFLWCDGWRGRARHAWRLLKPSSGPASNKSIVAFVRWRARAVLGTLHLPVAQQR